MACVTSEFLSAPTSHRLPRRMAFGARAGLAGKEPPDEIPRHEPPGGPSCVGAAGSAAIGVGYFGGDYRGALFARVCVNDVE